MKTFRLMWLGLLLLLASSPAFSTVFNAADCNLTTVQAAVNGAASGDTINLPTCSVTWAGSLNITDKSIAVIGNGEANTVITCQTSHACFTIISNSNTANNSAWRVSSLKLQGTGPGGSSPITVWDNHASAHYGFRIDHVTLDYPGNTNGYGIFLGGPVYGVIDHATINWGTGMAIILVAALNTEDGTYPNNLKGAYVASQPLDLGTNKAVYIEDSTFTSVVPGGCAAYDTSSGGGRVVFRYNTLDGCMFYDHWTRAGEIGGILHEVYNNTFIGRTGIYDAYPMRIESGTGVVFNNTFSGYTGSYAVLDERRGNGFYETGAPIGACNGAQAMDGNAGDPAAPGWPCFGQVGRAPGVSPAQSIAGSKQASAPIYFWNNGPEAGCSTGGTCTNTLGVNVWDGSATALAYVKATAHPNGDVDYVLNGSTAKPGYTAFTYPHPLAAAAGGGGGGSYVTPAVVQSAVATTAAGVHTTTTTGITTTTGNSFVVFVQSYNSPTDIAVSDSKGNTYTQIGTTQDSYWPGGKLAAYYVANGTGGATHTFSATSTVGEFTTVSVLEISGANTASFLDQNAGWNRSFTSPFATATTGTTVQDTELALALYSTGTVGTSENQPLVCGSGYTLSVHQDTSATPTGGICSAVLTSAGTYSTTATVAAGDAQFMDSLFFTIKAAAAAGAPSISSATTASGTVGTAFSYNITATNTPTSYGAAGLPAGLSVNTSTGAITGTPSASGTFNVTLSATNGSGTGAGPLTLTISPQAPAINSSLTASATVGTAFSYTITATNTPSGFTATGLPTGLSVNAVTGVISGTPTAAGTSNVTIGASNATGSDSKTLVITTAKSATTTTVVSSVNPLTLGNTVTYTVTVSPSIATGTVAVKEGGTTLCTTGSLSGGTSFCSVADLTEGAHTITAVYAGDSNYLTSTSAGISQTVSIVSAPPGAPATQFTEAAGTYCVRADGTATTLATANGRGDSKTRCMSMTTAMGQAFPAGSVVNFYATGGAYTDPLSNTATAGTGAALSSGTAQQPIRFVGVSDKRGQAPILTWAGGTVPRIYVGSGANYLEISNFSIRGASAAGQTAVSVQSGGSAGAGYTIKLRKIAITENNLSATGQHTCFAFAGSQVEASELSAYGCVPSASAGSSSSTGRAVTINGSGKLRLSKSAFSLVGHCLETIGSAQTEASNVSCDRVIYSGIWHGVSAVAPQTSCSNCTFSFNETTLAPSSVAGFFSNLAGLPGTVRVSDSSVGVHVAQANTLTVAGNVTFERTKFVLNNRNFRLNITGKTTISDSWIRLKAGVDQATAPLFAIAATGELQSLHNTWIFDESRSVSQTVPFSGSTGAIATFEDNAFIGCSRLYGAPTAASILPANTTVTAAGNTCSN